VGIDMGDDVIRSISGALVLVTKLLCCGLDKHGHIFAGERTSHGNIAFAVHLLQEIENIGQCHVQELEFELDLAALLAKRPLERLNFAEGRL
jgi:hypothetical protein